ncbi:MAG TPA: hypothetical protein VGL81_35770 [Polyangiaceae bacterium]|jgi:hypothetical protein
MRPIVCCMFFVSVAGCTDLSSADLKTAGMSADITVSADGTGQSQVTAQFHVDDNATDFVSLSTGDSATAACAGQTETLSQSNVLGDISYQTSFTGEDGAGAAYTVALTRTSDVSAPSSTCTMPSPFTVTAPTSSGSYSRSTADLTVTYTNGGTQDPMSWSVSGDCVSVAVGSVSNDAGTFTIPRGSLTPAGSSQTASATCQATLTLTRSRQGQLDSHYGSGGSIFAQQIRTVTFNSAP